MGCIRLGRALGMCVFVCVLALGSTKALQRTPYPWPGLRVPTSLGAKGQEWGAAVLPAYPACSPAPGHFLFQSVGSCQSKISPMGPAWLGAVPEAMAEGTRAWLWVHEPTLPQCCRCWCLAPAQGKLCTPCPRQQHWRQRGLPYLAGKSGAGSLARRRIRVPFTLAPLLWSRLPPSPTAHGEALARSRTEGQ